MAPQDQPYPTQVAQQYPPPQVPSPVQPQGTTLYLCTYLLLVVMAPQDQQYPSQGT